MFSAYRHSLALENKFYFLSADAALSSTVRHIVISRARYECANNGYADGIIQTLAEDAVGTGPRLQLFLSDAQDAQNREKAMRAAMQRREMRFRDWTEQIDLTEKLKLARIAKARDGEVFLRIVRNPAMLNNKNGDTELASEEAMRALWAAAHNNGKDIESVCRENGVDPKRISKRDCWRMINDLNKRSGYGKS